VNKIAIMMMMMMKSKIEETSKEENRTFKMKKMSKISSNNCSK
jgi:hypothetical protein